MASALEGLANIKELRQRVFFLLMAVIVYRIGVFVPVPGIRPDVVNDLFESQQDTILGVFNMFSGGALSRFSVFALGIMPYISASIIVQLMSHVLPTLEQLRKEGQAGRAVITKYTRYLTVVLATFQAIGISFALSSQTFNGDSLIILAQPAFIFIATVTLVTGTMFIMWLGEQITERGIGNGISIIILAGIIAGLPSAFGSTFEQARTGQMSVLTLLFIMLMIAAVLAFVVWVERAFRKVQISHAGRQQGNKMAMAGQSSHLPLKLNMAGVIPPIFASSLVLFPTTLVSWFGSSSSFAWLGTFSQYLAPGQPLYMLLYAALIMFFCFFYTALVFNSNETADQLKKSGSFIPGIRPGKQTADYVDKILTRLTLWGAIYVVAVCLLPELLIYFFNVQFNFGGTSLLIMVVVILDLLSQIQSHLISHQYDSLMKKTNKRSLR
jgi:preprotein translocase subunit SecY